MIQRVAWFGAIVGVVIAVAAMVARYSQENSVMAADQKKAGESQVAHMVFFTLKDSNDENRKRLGRSLQEIPGWSRRSGLFQRWHP